jgi:hypothetical protein
VRRFRSAQIRNVSLKAVFLAAGIVVAADVQAEEQQQAASKGIQEETQIVRAPTEKSFYGWQILVAGGLGGVLAAASMALPERPMAGTPATAGFVVGLPFYVFGGPVVHWTHGNFSKGLMSFGANIVVPFAAGIAAMGTDRDDHTRGFGRGAAVGMLVVPVLDALLLGWEEVPVEVVTEASRCSTRVSLSPSIEMRPKGGVIVGVRGAF